MKDCPLCRKIANPPADELVWEFPHSLAILGLWQFYQGYSVLVARTHARELYDLPDAERRAFFDEMCTLARALDCAFRPRKLNCELLGNQVPHLHWHLFPRYEDDPDNLKPVWVALDRAERDPAERERLQAGSRNRQSTINRIRRELTTA